MPRIKSLLNGEVQNVRGDIAREMIKLGVAVALDPIEESQRKGYVVVSTDGTVNPDGEPAYRLPKPGDAKSAAPRFYVDLYEGKYVSIFLEIGGLTRRYSGDPARIHNRRDHSGREFCSTLGFPVPVEIQKEYQRQWSKNPNLREPQSVAMPPGFTGGSNSAMAAEKEAYDNGVAGGTVPFSGAEKKVIG